MGFMGFFSRKSTPVPQQRQHDPLQAQPYNATVASLPPKIGTVPVAGNGPNILETLQKTHPKFKNTRDISFGAHSPALPPSIIQDDSFDRPQTAPTQDRNTWSARRRSGSLDVYVPAVPTLPPPPPPKPRPPYRLPDKVPTNSSVQNSRKGPPYRLPDNILDRAILNKPLPSFARGRSLSIASSRSSVIGGHVDLLDAQAGFAPTDFRLRIRANGARDYGEDVADRNIGDNGSSLHSGEGRTSFASRNGSRPTSLVPVARDEFEDQFGLKQNKRHSLASSLRSTSLTSSALATKSKLVSPLADAEQPPPPIPPKSRIRVREDGLVAPLKAEWRKSLPSYATSSRQLRVQDHAGEITENLRAKSSASGRVDDEKNDLTPIPQLHEEYQDKVMEEDEIDASTKSVPRPPRDSESKAEDNNKRRSMSHILNWGSSTGPSKRLSLQNLQALSTRLDSFKDEAFRIKPRATAAAPPASQHRRPSTAGSQDLGTVAEIQMKAFSSPPKLKASPRRLTARERLAMAERVSAQRPGSSKGSALLRIDSNEIPDRSSSMRQWSMDSTSATSLSSNPFRPQSRHTADTSIDFSPLGKEASISHDSLGLVSYRTGESSLPSPLATSSITTPPLEPMHRSNPSDLFNIDDYLSSDDDPDAPRHPRGEGEEHLLFKDAGFAFSGSGLPGLNGALDTGAPRYLPSSPPRLNSRDSRSARPHQSYDYDDDLLGKYKPPRAESKQAARLRLARERVAAYQFGDSDSSDREEFQFIEDDDSEDELSFDIPMRRPNPAHSYRPARYASREQVIEEEADFSQLDLASAVRIRKEEKRRKRLSGASGSTVRPRSNSGKGKEVVRPRRYDVAGFDAH